MSCIHYKFNSKLNYDTVTFNGLHITLSELKMNIMRRDRLKATICDLQISNAQTKEEYTDDGALIPKNSSVIVRRVPISGVKATSKTFIIDRSERSGGSSTAAASISWAQLLQTDDLVNMSEEEKIKAIQSMHEYGPIHYTKNLVGPPRPSYICFRCGKSGHFIQNCPIKKDKRMRRSTGIPHSFLMEVDDPSMKGVMLTSAGTYVIPTINVEAYAHGKKEKPPFLPQEQSSSSEEDPMPDELLCPICRELMTDAVVIPCCGSSYCDECVRTSLLESDDHVCPTCNQSEVSPDDLDANSFLRQAINNFKNGTSYNIPPATVSPTGSSLASGNSPTLSSLQLTGKQNEPLVVKPLSHGKDPSERPTWQHVLPVQPQPPVTPPVYVQPFFPPLQHAPFLSKEELDREQWRLNEKNKSNRAEELLVDRNIQKKRKRSYSRSKSPYHGSSHSTSSHSRTHSHFRSHRSRSSSRSPYSQRGRARRRYRSRSQTPTCHCSRSHSPSYRRQDEGMSSVYHREYYQPHGQGHITDRGKKRKWEEDI